MNQYDTKTFTEEVQASPSGTESRGTQLNFDVHVKEFEVLKYFYSFHNQLVFVHLSLQT